MMNLLALLRSWLTYPEAQNLALDDPALTRFRRQVILQKPFLKKLYEEWYGLILREFPPRARILEIGSGAGFLPELAPRLISSEFLSCPDVDVRCDARFIPFQGNSLDGIVCTNVFHHIPDVASFLSEAVRVLTPGGKLVMIEPWNTSWSRWVYRYLHHEPFFPNRPEWAFASEGPLSDANGALPWMVFERDRGVFEARFPQLQISGVQPLMPVAYLFSGGLGLRFGLPGFLYRLVRLTERLGNYRSRELGMFACVVIMKRAR